ncbi:MAG TPA: peptidyl-prolyl cis-trans isomerase [Candidatus Acidoferrales bacterium]|nr:peptidyl-prolyl cis-trans isomerase [Candidatus Acidoferrales bacterium]
MLDVIQKRQAGVKILMGVILSLICLAMVITLVPGLIPGTTTGMTSPDSVARVGSEQITRQDVQELLNRELRGQQLPPSFKSLYAKQVLDQLILEKALDLEGQRIGLKVTPQEETDRIKKYLPTAFNGNAWVGQERYTAEVQSKTGMNVQDFEDFVRQQILEEKFRSLLTDGITVSDGEILNEFRRRNEKVTIEYALIKPAELAAKIDPSEAELSQYFAKNMSKYQIPEKRSANFALLDLNALKQHAQVSDDELRAYYNQHIDEFKVENRVHAEHILFKTLSKTDAEVAEIQKKAEDVLKKAKAGANFEDLAKKYSEDTTASKGGDLGWIVEGQTVPEFEHAAFSLPKGTISDLVKTQYGFHIIKVLDKETARTKSFDEVRAQILPIVLEDKVNTEANQLSDQIASAVRQSNRQSLDAIAKKFNLVEGTTAPVTATEPVGELGNSADLQQTLFALRPGEISSPLRIERGTVILSLKDVLAAHQATLAEVHDTVLADYRKDNSVLLARSRADDLAKRTYAGESLDKAAKELGITVATSQSFARVGQVGDLGSASQFEAAFSMPVNKASDALPVGGNWVVYQVVAHEDPKPEELILQRTQLEQQLLQTKKSGAFEAFETALKDRLTKDGKLVIDQTNLKALSGS